MHPINGHHGVDTASWSTPIRPALKRSRIGGRWVAAVGFAVGLLLLLIFVLQTADSRRAPLTRAPFAAIAAIVGEIQRTP